MKREIVLTDAQNDALIEAAHRAKLPVDEFIITAVRALAARYGVEVPATPPKRVKPSGVTLLKSAGGRPRKEATHEMERHVPAGERATVCPYCHRGFRCDDWVTEYCSLVCEKRAQSMRNYQRRKARS